VDAVLSLWPFPERLGLREVGPARRVGVFVGTRGCLRFVGWFCVFLGEGVAHLISIRCVSFVVLILP